MAEKDLSGKYLEEYPDVFADIFNVLLFEGECICTDDLLGGPTESIYKAENGLDVNEQRRDISKYLIRDNKIAASLGIENQSYHDSNMPIRIIGYDYSSYRSQIINANGKYPVITLVLNFTNKEWDNGLSLKGYLDCPEDLNKYISDYRTKVINVAFIPKAIRCRLKSDFRIIADFFAEMRENGKYIPNDTALSHEMAVLNMLKVFTGDERYEVIEDNIKKRKDDGEVISMCTFIDEWENKGIQIGIKQGIQQGIEQGIQQGISNGKILGAISVYRDELHLNTNDIIDKIMTKFGLKIDEVQKYLTEK